VGRTLEGQVRDLEALVSALLGRDDRGVADQGVVDAGVGNQVGLELVQVDVEGTVEAQGRGDGGDDLGDQTVEVLVARPGNVQIPAADVVDGLVVDQEGAVRVLDGAVGGQDGVVGLDNGRGQARGRVDGELELALLGVVGGEALEQERAKAGTSATAERVEDEEALEGLAVVCFLSRQNVCAGPQGARDQGRDSPVTRRMRSMTPSIISLPMV
jgi:hypothetical protein